MKSRMDKYENKENISFQRTKKNTELYENVYEDIYKDMSYKNMEVIDSAKEINLNKLKGILDDKYDTRQYRKLREYSLEDTGSYNISSSYYNEPKSHDINEIINNAKSKRAFIEETKEKQKYMDFKERLTASYDEYSSLNEEKELEELINTMAIPIKNEDTNEELDMFSELKGEENTIVTNPIEVTFETKNELEAKDIEKTLVRADKTFYTDSNMFTKNDFEDFSTLTREFIKTNNKKKFIIIILIVIILFVIAFFAYARFMTK